MLSNNTMYVALPVRDMKKAIDFYGNLLGLTMVEQNERGTWYQVGVSRMVLFESQFDCPKKSTAAVWEVSNPKGVVGSLRKRGVKFERYDFQDAKRVGYIHHFPSYDAAWFNDPSGNSICITHHL